jgi:hypothetical protein
VPECLPAPPCRHSLVTMGQQCVPLRKSLLSRVDTNEMTPMDVLPDDVLLYLSDFCLDQDQDAMARMKVLQSLVHVCRRWRGVVFGSPRRLYFCHCTPKTLPSFTRFSSINKMLPSNPLRIRLISCKTCCDSKDGDFLRGPRDVSSAREHHRRLLRSETVLTVVVAYARVE